MHRPVTKAGHAALAAGRNPAASKSQVRMVPNYMKEGYHATRDARNPPPPLPRLESRPVPALRGDPGPRLGLVAAGRVVTMRMETEGAMETRPGRAAGEGGDGEDTIIAVAASQPQPLDALWKALMELFRQERPSVKQLTEIQGVARLALSVARDPREYGFAHNGACDETGDMVNVAEASALYGYWLGYHQGQQLTNTRA